MKFAMKTLDKWEMQTLTLCDIHLNISSLPLQGTDMKFALY
jgi:hypothetical protein